MSYKPEVIADSSGKWTGNALRFETVYEAEQYVEDLKDRWTLVSDTRVVKSDEPVNYVWRDSRIWPVTHDPEVE